MQGAPPSSPGPWGGHGLARRGCCGACVGHAGRRQGGTGGLGPLELQRLGAASRFCPNLPCEELYWQEHSRVTDFGWRGRHTEPLISHKALHPPTAVTGELRRLLAASPGQTGCLPRAAPTLLADGAAPWHTGGLRGASPRFSNQRFPAVPGGRIPVTPAISQAAQEGNTVVSFPRE